MYVSRSIGDDTWSCEQTKPCKTISRAVELASSGDRILLDGTNTDKDPYNCSSGTSHHPGIYVNKSLSLIGYTSPMPHVRCNKGMGLMLNGTDTAEEVNVTISGIVVYEGFVKIQDSSVNIDGCKFENSKHGVDITIYTRTAVDVQITNSTFSGNSECVSLVANGSNISSKGKDTQVMFKLKNSSFKGNVLSDEGGCISFESSPNDRQSVFCNITLANVIFSRNQFSLKGLIFLEVNDGKQHIQLENVTFIDNSPSSDMKSVDENEVIIRSNDVDIVINSSILRSQHARFLNVTSNNLTLQICNTSFNGNRVKGNGGVISLRSEVCTFTVYNSSFVNTSAAQGGVINIESVSVKANLEGNTFTGNTAMNEQGGGGGAVYILSPSFLGRVDTEAKYGQTIQGAAENCLQINISSCSFTNAYSSSLGSGLIITAVKVVMRLRDSLFTNCTAIDKERMGGSGAVVVLANLPSPEETSERDLFLTVEGSHFIGCSGSVYFGASLVIVYKTHVEINITNSHFISNYGGAVAVQAVVSRGRWIRSASNITIRHSRFSNNSETEDSGGAIFLGVYNHSKVSFENVTMEHNKAGTFGGAVSLSKNCTLRISKSRFLQNTAPGCGGAIYVFDIISLQVEDSLFYQNYVNSASTGSKQIGGALCIANNFFNIRAISISNTRFIDCLAKDGGGAMSFNGILRLEVKSTLFIGNIVLNGYGGALQFSLLPDYLKNPGCREDSIDNQPTKEFPSWLYRSHLNFENTTFERNAAASAGAMYLTNGKATFQSCSFIDNFASTQGGNLFTLPGSASLIIQDSVFRQTISELQPSKTMKRNYSLASFIHAESSGALKLYNTTFEVAPYGSSGPYLLVRNGRLIDLGRNNLTTFSCSVGSEMEVPHLTVQFTTEVHDQPCTIEVSTLELSCFACQKNSYSLQRGRALGLQVVPGFQCLVCPFGANCSQNIIAKPNFWGYKEKLSPPTLKFTMCPLGYCCPPLHKEFPEYNGCLGNRSGELCGQCSDTYSETLYSTHCRPSHECNDYWFLIVVLIYVFLIALYFTFKPSIIPSIKRHLFWFNNCNVANEEEFDRGYVKIVFYLYQAADLLLVSNSSRRILKAKFIEPIVGLFNFHQKFSSSGLVCPFPGLTVVTKRLFSASQVFGTCVMIGLIYMVHWGVQKLRFRGQGAPSVGPYLGGILQTMLLGYATLASASFDLLRCVSIGSDKRLFYDGNVECFQWWQYILIVLICVLFVPFVLILFWGPVKLFRASISVGQFLFACCFPFPCLLYWIFASNTARNLETDLPTGEESKIIIEKVIYGPFKRPDDGASLSLSWESVLIGRYLILIVLRAFVSDPMSRLLVMTFFCALFLAHHAFTQPFRDRIANMLETISLLSLVLLATVNVFFASLLSLAVPLNEHFNTWWDFCEVVEVVILGAVPVVSCLLVFAAMVSQLCRIIFVVCISLRNLFSICFSFGCREQTDETRPIIS